MKPLLWLLTLLAFVVAGSWWKLGGCFSEAQGGRGPQPSRGLLASNLQQLLAASSAQIGEYDIALLDLLCAEGLPGAEAMNPQDCIATLDGWAERVRSETERNLHRYRANPREFDSSEAYFRMLMMAVVVYEDFSVRYNPERISSPGAVDPNDHFFADSRDIFLHGLLQPTLNHQPSTLNLRFGTCSSMPVLYIAIGRRLGYPLKLVTTKSHLFLRWEGAGERFNLEATGKGMNRYDDKHFKQWPFPVTEEEIQADGYLKSLTPVEELALFFSLRGHCLKDAGRMSEAVTSYTAAVRLVPAARPYCLLLAAAQQERARPGSSAGVPPASAAGVSPAIGPPPAYPQASPLLPPPPLGMGAAPAEEAVAFPSSTGPQPATVNQPPDPNPLLKIRQR